MNPLNVCSSGDLVREISRNGFSIFVGGDLRPGRGRRAEITIVNLGTLPATFHLLETGVSNELPANRLILAIKELSNEAVGRRVFLGEIGQLPACGIDLGRFEAGESRTYRFTVGMSREPVEGKAKSAAAKAIYEWRATPCD